MLLLVFTLLLLSLFLLPIWLRNFKKRQKHCVEREQKIIFLGFNAIFIMAIVTSFFTAWFSYLITIEFIAPYLTGYNGVILSDTPLTSRKAIHIGILFLVPYLVFFKIGLVVLRDISQILKEQRDLISKHQKNKT